MADKTRAAASSDVSAAQVASLRRELAAARQRQRELEQQLHEQAAELASSQSHLLSLVKYAPSYIHIVDPDLRVSFINRGGGEVRPEHVVGTRVGDFMSPEDRRRVRRQLRKVLKTGQPAQYEFAGPGWATATAWYRTYAGPITHNGNNEVTGLVLITFDITEDRYRTEALKEGKRQAEAARARDRALLQSVGEGLLVINPDGTIASINPAGAAMLRSTDKRLVGRSLSEAIPVLTEKGEELDASRRPAGRAIASSSSVTETVRYRRRDGSEFPVALTVAPIVIKGELLGVIEVFRDLTQEQELEQAKEEFVSLASHQLRTPATGIKAYISMLLDGYVGPLLPRQAEFLRRVYQANERQLQIVNDMLQVAQIDAGRIMPEFTPTDLGILIREVINELRALIREREQRVALVLPPAPVRVQIDAKLMRMAVENILHNASKYTPAGGDIRVELGAADDCVVVAVRDNGVGIAKEDLPKLFKRFSRIDNSLSAASGGTGLGLYLTDTIVKLHNGNVGVESRPGVGTVFRVELPAHQ